MKKILFTGGGSAGHVVPNIALIEELLASGEADICYMGTNGIEKQLIMPLKIPYREISCPKFIRGFSAENLKIPSRFLSAKKQAEEGLKQFHPDLVFSKGGYVSLPVVYAAAKLKIPCLTHESDLSAGLANKLIAKKCKYILTSFPETANKFANGKYCGSPLRRSILSPAPADCKKIFGFPTVKGRKTVLIFGGGSGSKCINEAVRKHLSALVRKYDVLHICGKGNVVECNYTGYKQFEFLGDMGIAYAAADLVVSRAGSNTIFEIAALKKPSLLIPLEGQTRGDQAENAAWFSKRGLARVLKQTEIDFIVEAIDDAFADEKMKDALAVSDFSGGNANILYEIRRFLS